ncbi:MAG: penicillin-binding protein 2 [Parcubacteria group bacterium Licking1014_17]|nr:MAG: penicillin-binding protein 2 [Parcubacteria group bacterium Licking1014_17]
MARIYKIKRTKESDVMPEETLLDSRSEHTMMEAPISRLAFRFVYFVIGAVLVFFVVKAFQFQVVSGSKYERQAIRSNEVLYFLPSLRGIIYDRNGNPLVENIPQFDVMILQSDLPHDQQQMELEIVSLSKILGLSEADIRKTFDGNSANAIFKIKSGVAKETAISLESESLPGVRVVANPQRNYFYGSAFAHILGYTTLVGPEDMASDFYYKTIDQKGSTGLEAYYETALRGEHGIVDFKDETSEVQPARLGNSLGLTADKDVQLHLFDSVSRIFKASGVSRGAAVVQNVKTGAVLGLVSVPSFDPNAFERSYDDKYRNIVNSLLNDTSHPLFNRAIAGLYSPGSTIKPLLALAGLKEGVITPQTLVNAQGSISVRSEVDPNVIYSFRDWKVHGLTDIRKAISDSVDVYFYILGGGYENIRGLGVDKISEYYRMFLADRALGIDLLGEASGLVPDKEWKMKTKGEAWYVGDTYNISIGQGDLSITPLWLNSYISAIANGGYIYRPYLVSKEFNEKGELISETKPEIIQRIDISSAIMNVVREGMHRTTTTGTARSLSDLPVQLAAKTGTAQTTGSNMNSLFTVYGPYGNPDIVMTVLVENIKESQSIAVRVAHDFLSWYFAKPDRDVK